ncbi:unnamed protein product [Caenorhabditis angaria]|uniref:Uncharacterized protein n=1 Tax=Caenorhabditis angaria TaxID=860376 RepID=A0A9P1N6F4_9PELO|nr:unnamed protein product [Caenorhabditis angaria]
MSRMKRTRKKRTTVRAHSKIQRNVTIDEEESASGIDPIFQPAEQGVRKTLSWILKTQNQPGGLIDAYSKIMDKVPNNMEFAQGSKGENSKRRYQMF